MKSRVKVGLVIIFMGSMAAAGNYLWLIGVLAKPSEDLMSARWVYAGISYFFGSLVAWMDL